MFSRDYLLNHVLSAIPRGLGRDEWLHALPRALVAGFVKTDKEFQRKGMEFVLSAFHFLVIIFISCFGNANVTCLHLSAQDKHLELQLHL